MFYICIGSGKVCDIRFVDLSLKVATSVTGTCTCRRSKGKSVPLQARGAQRFQEVKVPRLRDNGPGWW